MIIFSNKNGEQISFNSSKEEHKPFITIYAELENWSAYLEKDGDIKALTREQVLERI